VARVALYPHAVRGATLDHCYDCAAEAGILTHFLGSPAGAHYVRAGETLADAAAALSDELTYVCGQPFLGNHPSVHARLARSPRDARGDGNMAPYSAARARERESHDDDRRRRQDRYDEASERRARQPGATGATSAMADEHGRDQSRRRRNLAERDQDRLGRRSSRSRSPRRRSRSRSPRRRSVSPDRRSRSPDRRLPGGGTGELPVVMAAGGGRRFGSPTFAGAGRGAAVAEWEKVWSTTHEQFYFFNERTQTRKWERPEGWFGQTLVCVYVCVCACVRVCMRARVRVCVSSWYSDPLARACWFFYRVRIPAARQLASFSIKIHEFAPFSGGI
jgi:hypothetical protein